MEIKWLSILITAAIFLFKDEFALLKKSWEVYWGSQVKVGDEFSLIFSGDTEYQVIVTDIKLFCLKSKRGVWLQHSDGNRIEKVPFKLWESVRVIRKGEKGNL